MVEPFHRNVPTRTVMQIINILPLNSICISNLISKKN